MTVSANYSYNPSCDAILRQAMQIAGVLPLGRQPAPGELQDGREFMNSFLKSSSVMGAALTQMEETTATLISGTGSYVLAADTIEIDFPMKVLSPGQTSESEVRQMVFAEYQEQSDHTTTGTPYACYVQKQASVTLKFWPVPNAAFTVRYRRQRLIRDMEPSSTLDLTQRWFQGLLYSMAHFFALAGNIPQRKVEYLSKEAESWIQRAHGRENEGGGICFVLGDYY